jgi:hypothetical protein
MQYVSWKQGDPAIKADPQMIKPKTWTLLKFDKNVLINPTADGLAHLGMYMNIKDFGNAKQVMVRFIRDPKGVADFTGATSWSPADGHIFSHMWMIQAKKGVPLGVEVYHDGTKAMAIATREFKAAIG